MCIFARIIEDIRAFTQNRFEASTRNKLLEAEPQWSVVVHSAGDQYSQLRHSGLRHRSRLGRSDSLPVGMDWQLVAVILLRLEPQAARAGPVGFRETDERLLVRYLLIYVVAGWRRSQVRWWNQQGEDVVSASPLGPLQVAVSRCRRGMRLNKRLAPIVARTSAVVGQRDQPVGVQRSATRHGADQHAWNATVVLSEVPLSLDHET